MCVVVLASVFLGNPPTQRIRAVSSAEDFLVYGRGDPMLAGFDGMKHYFREKVLTRISV